MDVVILVFILFRYPINDYTIPITQLKNWFSTQEVTEKRSKIAELIRKLAAEQDPEKEFKYPDIPFAKETRSR